MSEINDYLREIDKINRKKLVDINLRVIEIRKKYLENKKKIKQAQKEKRLNKKQGINLLAQPFVPRNLRFGKCTSSSVGGTLQHFGYAKTCKSQPVNLALYNRIKNEIKRKVKRWPSAYASGQLVSAYKREGGEYTNSCSRFGKAKKCKSQPVNLRLYNRIKNEVKRKVKRWPSAYASGQLVRRYKSSGGKYTSRCSKFGKLDDWFAQKWVDVCTGRPCGRKAGENRKYPYCRPTRTVGNTPRRMSQLTPAQIRQRCKKKHLIKGKRLNNFGKEFFLKASPKVKRSQRGVAPLLLNLKNTKSILQLRKNIMSSSKGQPWDKIWTYIISNGITDITKIKYILKTKKFNVNKTPSKVYEKYIKKGNFSSFYSPGGTLLVIPNKPYINITDFAYHATQKEWISLWRRVAKETKKMKRPFYISTHGHGVNWLHVRLENKLKYNNF